MNAEAHPSAPEATFGPDRGTFRSLPLTILVLLLMWGLWSTYKIGLIRGLERYDKRSEVGFFWSESATHYRYYRMIGDAGVSWEVIADTLHDDTRLQYPEGVNVATHLPFGMELFYGLLHRRLAPSATPHVFLLHAICIFTGLSLLMVFLLARKLTGSNTWSLMAAVFYATAAPSFIRTVRGSFLYEDFALPFLIAAVALFLPSRRSIRRKLELPAGIAAGLLAGLAASFWHVSQYPLALVFIFLSLRAALTEEGEERKRFTLGALVGFAVASVALPMLRTNIFLLSLPMACLIHWSAWSSIPWLRRRAGTRRLALWTATLIAATLLFRVVNPASASYSHVFEYMVARVTHPFGLPQDPSVISFAARTLWEYSFMSADMGDIVGGFRFGLIFVPFMLAPLIVKTQWRGGLAALCGMAIALLVFGLMMRRFLVLAMPFVAVASVAGFALWWADRPSLFARFSRHRQLARVWPMAALALLLGNMATVPRQVAETQPRPVAEIGELCEWMKKNTGHDDAFFATIQMSAPILLHTDRPSLVHPIWEWPSSREKYEGLLQAAYGDEEPFWRALRKYKAAYFIYDRSMALPEGGGSLRYIAGQTGPLDFTWTVTKCQFAPESLRSFDLAWQNGLFRVYRLRESPAQDTPERAKELAQFLDDSYDPVFDARNFDRSDRGYVNTLPALEVILRANALVNQAMIAMDFSDRSSAEKYLQEAIRICPRHLNAYLQLAFLAHVEGQPARELECLKRAQAIAPLNREVARRMQPLLNPTPETLTTVQPATSLTITTPNPGRK